MEWMNIFSLIIFSLYVGLSRKESGKLFFSHFKQCLFGSVWYLLLFLYIYSLTKWFQWAFVFPHNLGVLGKIFLVKYIHQCVLTLMHNLCYFSCHKDNLVVAWSKIIFQTLPVTWTSGWMSKVGLPWRETWIISQRNVKKYLRQLFYLLIFVGHVIWQFCQMWLEPKM